MVIGILRIIYLIHGSKIKNGLLENEMILLTLTMKIEMKINKVVVNNTRIKKINYLKLNNYFYNQ